MIKTKVFRKYLSIGTLFLLIFIFLGFFFNHFIIETLKPKREMLPPLFFAKLVDKLGGEDKVRGIQELKEIHDKGPLPHLILIDKNGIILTEPSPYTPELSWKDILKPDLPYQYTEVPLIQLKFKNSKEFPSHGPPPSRLFGFGPKGPPPPEERKAYLVRLSSPIEYYLLIVPTPHRPPFDKDETDWIGLISFSTLIISLILGVGVTITFVYNSVKNGVEQADSVIDELRRGNLKARFVIKRSDEFGQAMKRFNVMADEIETLVNNLRDSQQAKSKLLQELAHDLRTPVASLKSFLETLHLKGNLLNESVKEEFLELSLKEVDYFGKLVEDLLFLTQMDTPS